MSDWVEISFSDQNFLTIEDGDRGKNYPKKSEFEASGYCLFLNTGNVRRDGFEFNQLEFISIERDELLRKGKLKRNDIVLTTRGTVGNVGFYNGDVEYNHIRINSGMVIIRVKKDKIYPLFLYQYVRSKDFDYQVEALTSGSAQPQLPIRDLKAIKLSLPPFSEQKAIAHILGKLDDKIELNRQMNQTLEAMAQALFKSWFVDFDPVIDNAIAAGNPIPDELKDRAAKRKLLPSLKGGVAEGRGGSLLQTNPSLAAQFPSAFEYNEVLGKWVPEGWEVKTIREVGQVITGKTPSSKNPDDFGVDFPFVTPTDFKNYFKVVFAAERGLSEKGRSRNLKRMLPKDSVLVSCIGSDMGKVVISKVECASNQQINALVPNDLLSTEYLYLFFKSSYELLRTLAFGGSTMPILNKTEFESINVLVPNAELVKTATQRFEQLDQKILENQKQIETLTQLRDRLLPELISGRVKVPDSFHIKN